VTRRTGRDGRAAAASDGDGGGGGGGGGRRGTSTLTAAADYPPPPRITCLSLRVCILHACAYIYRNFVGLPPIARFLLDHLLDKVVSRKEKRGNE